MVNPEHRSCRLYILSWCIRVVEHYIVGIYKVHRQEPGLSLLGKLLALTPEPTSSHRRDDIVMEITTLGFAYNIAYPHVVRKAVRLHLFGQQFSGVVQAVFRCKFLRQMPFSLVGRVIPLPTELVADSVNLG